MGNTGLPSVGNTFDLTLSDAVSTSFAILVSSTSSVSPTPLPGAPGCNLATSSEATSVLTTLPGIPAAFSLPVPNNAALSCFSFYQQAAVLDGAAKHQAVLEATLAEHRAELERLKVSRAEVPEDLMCPLTLELFLDPARSPRLPPRHGRLAADSTPGALRVLDTHPLVSRSPRPTATPTSALRSSNGSLRARGRLRPRMNRSAPRTCCPSTSCDACQPPSSTSAGATPKMTMIDRYLGGLGLRTSQVLL